MQSKKCGAVDADQLRFMDWLEIVKRGDRPLSDRAIACAFGVRHGAIANARKGVAWCAGNPLRRAWLHLERTNRAWPPDPEGFAEFESDVWLGNRVSVYEEVEIKERADRARERGERLRVAVAYAHKLEAAIAASMADEAKADAERERASAAASLPPQQPPALAFVGGHNYRLAPKGCSSGAIIPCPACGVELLPFAPELPVQRDQRETG